MFIPDIHNIQTAASVIGPYINITPILTSENLNKIFKAKLFFKCENFQKAGSFKSRGAVNALFSMNNKETAQGVGTHSSGNHAQALSRAAMLKNIPAYIVMPKTSPKVKINAVKEYGGKITFCEPNLKSREDILNEIISKYKAIEIHPYNNPKIIAGQGTCAFEIFKELKNVDIIMAPVGGGGLLSGTSLTAHFISPNTKVIAAEPANADDAYRSFYSGKLIPSVNPKTIADGLLTSLGSITFPIIRTYVHEIVRVSENGIKEAMRLIWERMKLIIEPSAAVPLGALLENTFDFKGKRIAIIISGGNADLDNLPWL